MHEFALERKGILVAAVVACKWRCKYRCKNLHKLHPNLQQTNSAAPRDRHPLLVYTTQVASKVTKVHDLLPGNTTTSPLAQPTSSDYISSHLLPKMDESVVVHINALGDAVEPLVEQNSFTTVPSPDVHMGDEPHKAPVWF